MHERRHRRIGGARRARRIGSVRAARPAHAPVVALEAGAEPGRLVERRERVRGQPAQPGGELREPRARRAESRRRAAGSRGTRRLRRGPPSSTAPARWRRPRTPRPRAARAVRGRRRRRPPRRRGSRGRSRARRRPRRARRRGRGRRGGRARAARRRRAPWSRAGGRAGAGRASPRARPDRRRAPGTGRRATAGGAQRAPQHGQRVARPGVEVERIGAVQDRASARARVAQGQRLRRERAVRVAVDVHARESERVEHGDHVVDRGARAVGVAAAAEQLAAAPDGEPVGPQRDRGERRVRELLQRRAVDQLRLPRPALVDQHERRRPPRRAEHREVVARPSRRSDTRGRPRSRAACAARGRRAPGSAGRRSRIVPADGSLRTAGTVIVPQRAVGESAHGVSVAACAGAATASASRPASASAGHVLTTGCSRAAAWGARRAW